MSIKKKFIYNFISSILPIIFGIFIIPILIKNIGIERFGMLTIAWMIIGYFGLLDMGLGRSLTQKVASRIGASNLNNLRFLIFIIILILFFIGILTASMIYFFSETLIVNIFNISSEYHDETIVGMVWLSLSIPFVLISTGLLGVLEGQQDFVKVAFVRAPLGILMMLFPLIIVQFTNSLQWILCSLFFVRLLVSVLLIILVSISTRTYVGNKIDIKELTSIFKFGGWVFISNLISPIMVYFDRFYIASILSVSVVAYYTTPFDVLIKILVIPYALVSVMFSTFSTHWSCNNDLVEKYFKKSLLAIIIVMFPIILIAYLFAFEAMSLWLGDSFAIQSYEILRVLSVGIFFNALGMIPFAFIQSIGKPDLTAKIHLIELPVYVLLIYVFIKQYGLIGAAYAWTFRTFLDTTILYYISMKKFKLKGKK